MTDTPRTRPPYHVLEFREDAWALEHEESCFQSGSLLDCPVHRWASEHESPPDLLGRYRVEVTDYGHYVVAANPEATRD